MAKWMVVAAGWTVLLATTPALGDVQRIAPGAGLQNAVVVDTGANGICDTAAARQAWKEQLGAEFTFASDFWAHGAAAKAYGVFNEANGAPHRGTFLIDKAGSVVWSLVNDHDERREELVSGPLDAMPE